MNNSRRDFMKLGAATLAAAVLPATGSRAADAAQPDIGSQPAPASPPLAAGELRLLTFAPREQPEVPRAGALHPAGDRVVDLGAAALAHSTSTSVVVSTSALPATTVSHARSAPACHWSRTSQSASSPTVSRKTASRLTGRGGGSFYGRGSSCRAATSLSPESKRWASTASTFARLGRQAGCDRPGFKETTSMASGRSTASSGRNVPFS